MRVNIDGICFSYSSVPVLKDVRLDIQGAQLVSIIGPNGVGKSTLIHCINKILEPSSGSVYIDDIDVKKYTLKELAKVMGYVPYSSSDAFPLTVVDTVLMGRHPHSGWKSTEKDLEIVYDALKSLGIHHLAMRPFDELSAGQHQKVMLARGLVQEPKTLLLDEPTANLDIKHQMEVTRMLRDLSRNKGITVIMISHDLNIAAKYSDTMIMMHEGSIFSTGSPEEVMTEANIKAVYGVDSRVIQDEGRPHLIVRDKEFDAEVSEHGDYSMVSTVKAVDEGPRAEAH
ncbi:ABC transporter ATP-binding protein [Methanomassiliicoccus luminyensis]|jgi:iron complex transport system ATP-binding protein|uniref:ABC transporter ATP-binding protein n=1 Tax=Methanomassiliicoccus luminyensis TaxID=1080712 RepID=UPI00037A57D1|nr:ABC transporter ATP-binding protein [Methanomassiliicoccus luminyensis]